MAQEMKSDASAGNSSPFGDLTKMFEQFKLPGVDMSLMVDARRKDIEALVEANTRAFEAMQALARTQTDMLTQAMTGMQQAATGMATGAAGVAEPGTQAEGMRNAWQKMLGDMKGLAEMAQKTQADAITSMRQRATQSMQEVQQGLLPTK